jgi:predicted RNase H-like nuclease
VYNKRFTKYIIKKFNNNKISFVNILKSSCLKFLIKKTNSANKAKVKAIKKNIVKNKKYEQDFLSKGPKKLLTKLDILYIIIIFFIN